MAFTSSEEREQINSLKAHQKTVRGHKASKKRVDALTDALADAQTDHAVAGTERKVAKENLLTVLENL